MPEYGRYVQNMVQYVMSIEDKEKRNEQIKAVINTMGVLNPQLRDIGDFKHKLWDHVQLISDFKLDIDSPYLTPDKESFTAHPEVILAKKTPMQATYYGRNIENMVGIVADCEDPIKQEGMIKVLATYMRKQYLIWNKETVEDEVILRDIERLSGGKVKVPEGLKLNQISSKDVFARPALQQLGGSARYKKNNNKNGKKRWKKQ